MEFKKVSCSAFLKKVNDGKFMNTTNRTDLEIEFCNTNDENFSLMSECCGGHEFLKTYYEIKPRVFSGMLVGFKDIVLTGWLCASMEYDYYDRENVMLSKEPEKVMKCGIVYYANNRKSYVPIEFMSEVES